MDGLATNFLSWTIGTGCIGQATLGPGTFTGDTKPGLNNSGWDEGRVVTGDSTVGAEEGGGEANGGTMLAASSCSAILAPVKMNKSVRICQHCMTNLSNFGWTPLLRKTMSWS